MEPYGCFAGGSRLSDHTVYYPKQDALSTPGPNYSRGSSTMYATSPSMSVYAPPALRNGSYPSHYYRSPYMDEDVYAGYPQRGPASNAAGGGDISDFSARGRQYERVTDYWSAMDSAQSDYSRTRSSPQAVYSSGPVRYQSLSDLAPRFRPRFGQPGGVPRVRPPRGVGGIRPRRTGLTSPSGDEVRRVPVPTMYCELCKVGCAGPKALAEHQNGQRHKKRMAQSEAIERLKQGSAGETLKTTPNANMHELRCELCDVCCTGAEAYSAHVSGKLHQRAVRLHRELGKPVPETDNPLVSSVVAKTLEAKPEEAQPAVKESPPVSTIAEEKIEDKSDMKKVELSKLVDDEKRAVGAEFIQVIPGPGGKGIHYKCTLCECQFTNADAKELHLKGRRHRLQYKKKVDPDLSVPRKPRNPFYKGTERQPEKGNAIPPMPSSSNLSWPGFIPTNDAAPFFNMQQPFPRINYRGSGAFGGSSAQHFNVTLENRYFTAKHSSIVPTELEAQAMKTAVGLCEFSLKRISDALFESAKRELTESTRGEKPDSTTKTDVQKPNCDETTEEASVASSELAAEENRLLRGVVRVGPLGKSLLLRGDHEGDLVLVCSEWPTCEVVTFIKTELAKQLTAMDDQYEYVVTDIPAQGQLTVRTTRKVPESELKADESIADEWPVITIRIQLTSRAACDDEITNKDSNTTNNSVVSGAVKAAADGSNVTANTALPTAPEQQQQQQQPQVSNTVKSESLSHVRKLFAQGERIPKNVCLDALDAIDQAKWFQGALMTPPLGIVARVLVDFMRTEKIWLSLNQFGVLALLGRLLNIDLQMGCLPSVRGQRPPFLPSGQPFGAPIRPRLPIALPLPLIGPGRLFRRFFEAISSGLLIQLREGEPQPVEPVADPADLKPDETDSPSQFFAYSLLATTPISIREEITVSAQFCLRQIAFKQLYKVLHMEPLSSNHAWKKDTTAKDSVEGIGGDSEVTETVEIEATAPGAVKRRRSEVDSVDAQHLDEADVEGEDGDKEPKEQQASSCSAPEPIANDQSSSNVAETASELPDPEVVAPPTTRSGTAAKRSRRGRY
ncbi:zinc finger RNA-binding protein [Clonorchis sinensis]|uniref:Zinc finger RNA-binding protein n=1 Tax=Clonorchis sinensis TaxID=79923 RepID=G7Y4L1_CLOSI|nr:zinc finger RNA-binding protein [Clonorchis sinensis]